MSKNGWFSTSQAPNPRPVSDVTNALQAINNKLDMILDALTKPAEPTHPTQEEKTNLFIQHWVKNPPSLGPSRPAALDVDDEYCSMKLPKGTEEEPRRLSGKPAKEQIERWIEDQFRSVTIFSLTAKAGYISAKIEARANKADETHRYTHRLRLKDDLTGLSFNPTLFGITEAREVVAYLESLGVKVNTNALNRV